MRSIKLYLTWLSLIAATVAEAKEGIETTISADIVSQYIWRGQDLGNVSLQPTLGIGYEGFSLSAWGNVGFSSKDTKELDITASYTVGGFNIGITDYWFNTGLDPENRYFYYYAHSTNHVFEANIGYDFRVLSLQWYTNIAGNDGLNKDGERAYSSYLEADAPFKLAGVSWTATAGIVPWGTTSYGNTGFAITNVSLRAEKEIQITDSFSIPIFGQVTGNPCSQKAYLVLGITLHP